MVVCRSPPATSREHSVLIRASKTASAASLFSLDNTDHRLSSSRLVYRSQLAPLSGSASRLNLGLSTVLCGSGLEELGHERAVEIFMAKSRAGPNSSRSRQLQLPDDNPMTADRSETDADLFLQIGSVFLIEHIQGSPVLISWR